MSLVGSSVPSNWLTRAVRTVMRGALDRLRVVRRSPPAAGAADATSANSSIARTAPDRGAVRVDAALEARARLGAEAEPLRGLGDAGRLEVRGLEQDLGRVVGDLGLGATHDPGDALRPTLGVADQEVVGGEGSRSRRRASPSSRPARRRRTTMPAPGEPAEVERVQAAGSVRA